VVAPLSVVIDQQFSTQHSFHSVSGTTTIRTKRRPKQACHAGTYELCAHQSASSFSANNNN